LVGRSRWRQGTVRDAEASGNPHQLAHAYSGLVAIAAGQRDGDRARQAFIQAQHWSNVAGNSFVPTIAPLFPASTSRTNERAGREHRLGARYAASHGVRPIVTTA
jgi:hypothetical protein